MNDNIRAAKEILEEFYEKKGEYPFLSTIGSIIRTKNIKIEKNLKDFFDFDVDGWTTVSHPTVKAHIVVCPTEQKDQVRVDMERRLHVKNQLTKFQKSFLLAFCVRVDHNTKVYTSITPPFKYILSQTLPSGDWLEIADEFRIDNLILKEISKLDYSTGKKLLENVEKWASKHQLPIEKFYSSTEKHLSELSILPKEQKNLLTRLIEAQPKHMRSEFTIPMDIIEVLISHG